jgi:hypothetical protein
VNAALKCLNVSTFATGHTRAQFAVFIHLYVSNLSLCITSNVSTPVRCYELPILVTYLSTPQVIAPPYVSLPWRAQARWLLWSNCLRCRTWVRLVNWVNIC